MRPERLGLGNKGYNKRACLALLLAKNSFYLLSVYVECSDDFVFTAFADNRCLYCDLDCLVFFRQKYNRSLLAQSTGLLFLCWKELSYKNLQEVFDFL